MLILAKSECESWCDERGLLGANGEPSYLSRACTTGRFPFVYESRKLAKLSKDITGLAESGCLVWITEFGIWPTEESWPFFYFLRNALGEERLLRDAPGHYFLPSESEIMGGFVRLCLDYGWGGFIIPESGFSYLFFSHDGWLEANAPDAEVVEGLKEILTQLDAG